MLSTPGIYRITNRMNGFTYIGKSAVSCEGRMHCHRRDAQRETGSVISRALRKYGADNFDFAIILSGFSDQDTLNRVEKDLIKGFKAAGLSYNITDGGEGVPGLVFTEDQRKTWVLAMSRVVRKAMSAEARKNVGDAQRGKIRGPRSDEVKAAVSLAQTGRVRSAEENERRRLAMTGKKLSAEHKAKIGAAHKGRKVGSPSEETKAKISAALTGRKGAPCSDHLRALRAEAQRGKKASEETRAKLRAAHARRRLAAVEGD